MLKMHHNEMNQSLYYVANLVEQVEENSEQPKFINETTNVDMPQATLKQIIQFVSSYNVNEIWAVYVGNNSSKVKHYVLLLRNWGYICSCLSIIQSGVICRHYFQVMLTTKEAVFHIRFIPTRWYNENRNDPNDLQEIFLNADKFTFEQQITFSTDKSMSDLCFFN